MIHIDKLMFWCQKVLPCVYDESLSYYEILCKMRDYINNLIEQDKVIGKALKELSDVVAELQKWIDDFDKSYVQELVDKYIATMIFVELDDDGYIHYYVPERWSEISFNTTGLDIEIEDGVSHQLVDFGHLILTY